MNKLSLLERKGLVEINGQPKTKAIIIEDESCNKTINFYPILKQITSLSGYMDLLKEINAKNESRLKSKGIKCGSYFFYRGQNDIEFSYNPTILRKKESIEREHLVAKEFHRQLYELFDNCKNAMEEQVHMQHYEVGSRILDLPENPLIALWAACLSAKNEKGQEHYGEVSIWCLDRLNDKLKAFDSSTVSVLANTSKCEHEFSLGHLETFYHKEHPSNIRDFIYLKDVLRSSVVVRPKYTNPRIKNQWTAFLIVNLNKMIDKKNQFKNKFGISVEDFSKFILESKENINVKYINEGKIKIPNMKNPHLLTSWDLCFEKVHCDEMPFIDSYGCYQYLYNNSQNKNEIRPIFAIIPPDSKKSILKELEFIGITESFIFPERTNISKYIKNVFEI
jgi:hypothetical protein